MEHKPLAELQVLADIKRIDPPILTREQRLERWIGLLEGEPDRKLRSLHEIEHLSPAQRRACRTDNSPLSVAFSDPILRTAGLQSDRIGDCMDFFELRDRQMHHAFCSCHVGLTLTGMRAAKRLRHLLRLEALRNNVTGAMSRVVRSLLPARLSA